MIKGNIDLRTEYEKAVIYFVMMETSIYNPVALRLNQGHFMP